MGKKGKETAFTLALLPGQLLGWTGLGSEQDEGNRAATLAEVLPCAQPGLSPSSGFAFSTS